MSTTDRELALSFFTSAKDNLTKSRKLRASELINAFTEEPEVVNSLNPEEKVNGPAWSPAIWSDGEPRAKEKVQGLSCVALDFDKSSDGLDGLTEHEHNAVFEWVEHNKWLFATHSSYTSGFCYPRRKFRLVLFTNRDVTPKEYEQLWDVITSGSPVAPDRSRRAVASIYFLPRVPVAHKDLYESWWGGERLLEVDKILPSRGKKTPLGLNDASVDRDWRKELRECRDKHHTLVRAAFRFGVNALHDNIPRERVADVVWSTCEAELKANRVADGVKDWPAAERTAKSQALLGWDRAHAERGAVTESVTKFIANDKQLAAAQNALRKELKLVAADATQLAGAAYRLGRFSPHVLAEEHVKRELFKCVTQTSVGAEAFVQETETRAAIDANVARGQKNPLYVYTGWKQSLVLDEEGKIIACDENAKLFFEHHPDVEGLLRWNVRRDMPFMEHAPPWATYRTEFPCALQDHDAYDAGRWLAKQLGKPLASVERTLKAMNAVAKRHEYDPFLEWLRGLRWDGVPRVDEWLSRSAAVEQSEYHRLVGRLFMLQAVARTITPGCEAQYVLVLVGNQGLGKSRLFRELVGKEYFCSNIGDIHKDEAVFNLGKYVVVELAELAAFKKAEMEVIKRFVSDADEDLRRKYAVNSERLQRRAVFGGTTNVQDFLQDTENRRFWPVGCSVPMNLHWLVANREQLWAEAYHRVHDLHEEWWPSREQEAELFKPKQAEHVDSDDLFGDLSFFEEPFDNWPADVQGLGLLPGQIDVSTKMFKWVTVAQIHIFLGTDIKSRGDQLRIKKMCLQKKWQAAAVFSSKKTLKVWRIG